MYRQFAKNARDLESARITLAKPVKHSRFNANIEIPAGKTGVISNIKSGHIKFTLDPCEKCGVSLIVTHLDYDIIGDITLKSNDKGEELVALIEKSSRKDIHSGKIDFSEFSIEDMKYAREKLGVKDKGFWLVVVAQDALGYGFPIDKVTQRRAFLKENGFKRVTEMDGHTGELKCELQNGMYVFPKGAKGIVTARHKGIGFQMPLCDCCRIKPHISGINYCDIKIIKD